MNENNKKISLDSTETDEEKKNSLRPLSLSEFLQSNQPPPPPDRHFTPDTMTCVC